MIGPIELTPEESAIRDRLILRQEELHGRFDVAESNGKLACQLMHVLLARNAIPESRLRYFDDPDYKPGRLKGSRKQMFERNRTKGDDIYRHANFLQHLRYFLLGAELPATIADEFAARVLACGNVSPSESLELGKLARTLTRKHGLASHDVGVEFLRLSLDCGMYYGHALRIQKMVEETR
jgi:hypothetical protein